MSHVTPRPMARPERGPFLSGLAYLGGLGLLALSALGALVRPSGSAPPLRVSLVRNLDWLLGLGLPVVSLISVSMGSFLAMQAFFMATFREASGAVVGVGLVRNLAPLVSGFTITALMAARVVPELRRSTRIGLDDEPGTVPDRDVVRGLRAEERPEPRPAELAAVRILSALIAGPVLALWGAVVGFVIGMLVAQSMLSVSPGIYLNKFREMIEPGDFVGLAVKSALFALAAALLACHEGLRDDRADPARIPFAAGRAAVLALLVILVLNSCWFTVTQLSGSPFGPTLAAQ